MSLGLCKMQEEGTALVWGLVEAQEEDNVCAPSPGAVNIMAKRPCRWEDLAPQTLCDRILVFSSL